MKLRKGSTPDGRDRVFGGTKPAIHSLKLEASDDQLPADLIECWATCFWCLQACIAAPLSPTERSRIDRYIAPLTEPTYNRTYLTEVELRSESVTSIMDGMSQQYAHRLGIDEESIVKLHALLCRKIFDKVGI